MAFDFGGALTGVATGARAGAILGPAGGAAGGLIGLAMAMAPEIGRWLAGNKGAEIAGQVKSMVAATAGSDDPDVAASNLAEQPERATALRLQLMQIVADQEAERLLHEREMMKAEIMGQMDARATSLSLAREHHPLAYGAAAVTIIILGLFAYTLVAATQIDVDMKETLKVLAVAAATYWIGSSRGSASKDSATKSADAATK
jgi:hypothetical protein